jgi:hypothetical protein
MGIISKFTNNCFGSFQFRNFTKNYWWSLRLHSWRQWNICSNPLNLLIRTPSSFHHKTSSCIRPSSRPKTNPVISFLAIVAIQSISSTLSSTEKIIRHLNIQVSNIFDNASKSFEEWQHQQSSQWNEPLQTFGPSILKNFYPIRKPSFFPYFKKIGCVNRVRVNLLLNLRFTVWPKVGSFCIFCTLFLFNWNI